MTRKSRGDAWEEPCGKLAVAARWDPTEGSAYPVCARHARADMVSLADLLEVSRQWGTRGGVVSDYDSKERRRHTLTVRFATEGFPDRVAMAAKPQPPQVAIGEALRDVLALAEDETVTLDEVVIIPDPIR